MPRVSKPGPRLADDAGTRTITTGQPGRSPSAAATDAAAETARGARARPPPGRRRSARGRLATPAARSSTAPPTTSAAPAFSTTMSRWAPRSPASTRRASVGVRRRVPAPQVLGRRAGEPQRRPDRPRADDLAVAQLQDRRGPGGGELVEAVVAVTSRTWVEPWAWSTASIRSAMRRVGDARAACRRTRPGLASGPRMLNAVGMPISSPGRAGVAEGGVEPGGEAEADPRFLDARGRRPLVTARSPPRGLRAGRPLRTGTTPPGCRACTRARRRRPPPGPPGWTR